jgi:SpoIID/LytB domain protein
MLVPAATVLVGDSGAHADTSPVLSIVIDGRGNGHGVGLSQWGAYGWATKYGKTWQEILSLYYGGTSLSTVAAGDFRVSAPGRVTVQLVGLDGQDTAAVSESAALTTSVDSTHGSWASIVARPSGGNVYSVWGNAAERCPTGADPLVSADGWVLLAGGVAGPITIATPRSFSATASVANGAIGACLPGGSVRYYRGTLQAITTVAGNHYTFNDVLLESYVKGVVPRESPAAWGAAAGGAGMNALRAQAVAARSYAVASAARASGAKICDTSSCQVYGGAAVRGSLAVPINYIESRLANQAVTDTADVVLRYSDGHVANTMFASSNGGRTVSNGLYPAVDDPGDAVAPNPHHAWSLTVSAAKILSIWPQLGTLLDISVLSRSGGGTWDGWINQMVLRGSQTSVTLSGDEFRRALGLKSRYLNFTLLRAPAGQVLDPGLLIGDSVSLGAKAEIAALTGDAYHLSVSAKAGRCTIAWKRTCRTNNGVASVPTSNPPAYAVVELGYFDDPSTFATAIDRMMTALVDAGVVRVVWVNLSERRLDASGQPVFAPANAALRAALGRWPQLSVLDWNAASSEDDAASWFVPGTASKPDFATLTTTGRSRFALFLRTQLDALTAAQTLPADFTTTTTTTTVAADPSITDSTTSSTTGSTTSAPTTSSTTIPVTQVAVVFRSSLHRGMSGADVRAVQQALVVAGFQVTPSGIFDWWTYVAVKNFQRKHRLKVDGVVGSRTRQALGL